jgi:[acyl-carrier-protein] S-malonyltransferase
MTKSIALLFPGQGSQYVGMGNRYANSPIFKLADASLKFGLSEIMLRGPSEQLGLTKITQPAILTYSIILFEELKRFGLKIGHVLGHSLGEYSALVAAGTLSFEDAIKAVHLRGQFMQEAVPEGEGKMYALLGAIPENVSNICQEIGNVIPANFNEPNQIVISGLAKSADRVVGILKELQPTGLRVMELKVSAPFHSPLMKPAAFKLEEAFSDFSFKENNLSYIANLDANEYAPKTPVTTIKKNLIGQVYSSVLWHQSFSKLPENTLCIEVGPGKVLSGLAKKIDPNIQVINLDTEDGFNNLEKALQ